MMIIRRITAYVYIDFFKVFVKVLIDPPAQNYRVILWQPNHMPGSW